MRLGQSHGNQIIDQALRSPLTMLIFSAMAVIMIGTAQDVPVNAPGNLWDPVYLLSVITSPSHIYFSTIIRTITAIVSSYLSY